MNSGTSAIFGTGNSAATTAATAATKRLRLALMRPKSVARSAAARSASAANLIAAIIWM